MRDSPPDAGDAAVTAVRDLDAAPAADLETTAYQDDGALVICDRSNPNAWIRASSTETLHR